MCLCDVDFPHATLYLEDLRAILWNVKFREKLNIWKLGQWKIFNVLSTNSKIAFAIWANELNLSQGPKQNLHPNSLFCLYQWVLHYHISLMVQIFKQKLLGLCIYLYIDKCPCMHVYRCEIFFYLQMVLAYWFVKELLFNWLKNENLWSKDSWNSQKYLKTNPSSFQVHVTRENIHY